MYTGYINPGGREWALEKKPQPISSRAKSGGMEMKVKWYAILKAYMGNCVRLNTLLKWFSYIVEDDCNSGEEH